MTDVSLRRSLLRWLLWPLVPILLCGAYIAFHLAWRATQDTFDLSLLDSALDLARQVRLVDGTPILDLPAAARQMLATSNEDRVAYVVKNSSGKVISGDPNLPIKTFPSSESRQQYYDAVLDGAPVRAIALRSELESGHIDIAVAQTLKARDRIFVSILVGLLIPEVLLAAASLAVIWFGVRRGLAPAERLRSEIVSRSPKDLRPIEESTAPLELRPILHAINELLARLDAALGGQRQLIADAAHQLRTPLAVLRARIELALGTPEDRHRETFEELLTATERTTRLANQLLSLARAEHLHASEETRDAVELKEVVTEVAGNWVVRAADRGIDLAFDLQPVTVTGNALLIAEMLGNLVDNAIRYTPPGGAVTVRTKTASSAAVLEVEDTGPGIPAEYRDKVRQRFFRLADARIDGCGLGLAIVDEIVSAHGAQMLFSEPRQGSGLIVTIRFPDPARP
jgi:two-component system sensor histidine kinase TctE